MDFYAISEFAIRTLNNMELKICLQKIEE